MQFRLTPCIVDFLGFALNGQLAPAMIAAARCLNGQNVQLWLRTFVYDDFLEWTWNRNRNGHEDNCVKVLKAIVSATSRIQSEFFVLVQKFLFVCYLNYKICKILGLAGFENAESRVNTLLAAAQSLDNLCRMEPVWHPWL